MRTLEKSKGRATHANFIGIPRQVADSAAYVYLPHWVRALYVDLRRQYNGRNNGDICAADGVLGQYGWSHSTIHKGLKRLVAHGLIEKSRQGGIGSMSRTPTLYAFTDTPIVPNPAKGIRFAQASWAYRSFIPKAAELLCKNKAKVHGVTAKVHAVDIQRSAA